MSSFLAAAQALTKNTETQTTGATRKRPVGSIRVKLGDLVIASQDVWKESTSQNQALQDLNEAALDNPKELEKLLNDIKEHLTFEVSTSVSDVSLQDVLKSLGK